MTHFGELVWSANNANSYLPPDTFNNANGTVNPWSGGEGFIADFNKDGFDVGEPAPFRWG